VTAFARAAGLDAAAAADVTAASSRLVTVAAVHGSTLVFPGESGGGAHAAEADAADDGAAHRESTTGTPAAGTLPVHVAVAGGVLYGGGVPDTLAARHPYLPQAHETVFSSTVLTHEVRRRHPLYALSPAVPAFPRCARCPPLCPLSPAVRAVTSALGVLPPMFL
jgi:hypothetical protein